MKLFTPPGAPSWLDSILRRIRQGLAEPWDSPLRPQQFATADLPDAATWTGGLVFVTDDGDGATAYSDGTSWRRISDNTIAGSYGWRDLTGSIDVRGTGANDPTFATYTGTTLRAYSFSATVMNEVFMVYHVPHDYVPGTDIFFHAHWSNAAVTPNTGSVIWKFDYSFAKGFDQAAFPAVSTVSVTQNSSATRYRHMVAETAAVTISGMEVDGLIQTRIYRDAATDTCTDAVFLHTADIHYQSNNASTKNKAPNFYT